MTTATATEAPTISETLRASLRGVDSLRWVEIRTGISRTRLKAFRRGRRSLTLESADRLAAALGLNLRGPS